MYKQLFQTAALIYLKILNVANTQSLQTVRRQDILVRVNYNNQLLRDREINRINAFVTNNNRTSTGGGGSSDHSPMLYLHMTCWLSSDNHSPPFRRSVCACALSTRARYRQLRRLLYISCVYTRVERGDFVVYSSLFTLSAEIAIAFRRKKQQHKSELQRRQLPVFLLYLFYRTPPGEKKVSR